VTSDPARKAHLLALAADAEREAKRFLDKRNHYDAERCRKLIAIYRDMAQATKEEVTAS
jgi:hypothetical protein